MVDNLKIEGNKLVEYSKDYKSLHTKVRKIQKKILNNEKKIKEYNKDIRNLEGDNQLKEKMKIESKIESLNLENNKIRKNIPLSWDDDHNKYKELSNNRKKAQTKYKRNVDEVYENIRNFKLIINDLVNLKKLENQINLLKVEKTGDFDQYIKNMKEVEKNLDKIAGTELIKDKITKSRRILKKDNPDLNKILSLLITCIFIIS